MYDMTLPITPFLIRPFVDTDEQPQKSEKMSKKEKEKKAELSKKPFRIFYFYFGFCRQKD